MPNNFARESINSSMDKYTRTGQFVITIQMPTPVWSLKIQGESKNIKNRDYDYPKKPACVIVCSVFSLYDAVNKKRSLLK